jgi:N-methylhydantoinase A
VGVAGLRAAFEALHERNNGWNDPGAPIELVTLRTSAVVPGPPLALAGTADATAIDGPTVLHLPETTVVVPQGWHGTTDASGTLVLERAV